MKINCAKRNFFLAASTTVAYAALIFICFGFNYYAPDDGSIRDILSGRFSGVPDAHIYFLTYPFTWAVMQMYILIPQIDWWGLLMLCIPLLCLFLILMRVLHKLPAHPFLAIFLTLIGFTCCGGYAVSCFNFTLAGSLSGATALFLFVTGDHRGSPIKEYWASFLLLMLAFLIRRDTFLMVFPFICVYALLLICRKGEQKPWRLLLRFILLAGVLGIACLASIYIHESAFSSPEWQKFVEFRNLRYPVSDYVGYPDFDSNQGFYQDLGLSREEYNCLSNTMLDYNADILDILKAAGDHGFGIRNSRSLRVKLWDAAALVWDALTNSSLPILSLAIALLLYLEYAFRLFCRKRYSDLLFLLAAPALFLAELGYLGLKGRITSYVMHGELWVLGISLGAALLNLHCKEPIASSNPKSPLPLALLILATIFWTNAASEKAESIQYGVEPTQMVRDYCAQHPENAYFEPLYAAIPHRRELDMKRFDTSFNNRVPIGSWNATSPIYQQALKNMGVEDGYSIEEAILHQDNVFVISEETYIQTMLDYFSWKYGDALSWEIVDTIEAFSGVNVYDFTLA